MDALFFLLISAAMVMAFLGYRTRSITILAALLPFVMFWFIYNINFSLKVSL